MGQCRTDIYRKIYIESYAENETLRDSAKFNKIAKIHRVIGKPSLKTETC